jgi:hypothetical protein
MLPHLDPDRPDEHLHDERERSARFDIGPAPKEQPPRKLSGKRTALEFDTLESGASRLPPKV